MKSELPADWTTVPLGECGKWMSGGTPSTKNSSYWDGDIPWISSGSLTSFLISDSNRRVTAKGAKNGTRLVPARTILFVVRGMSLVSEFRVGITQQEVAFGQDCKAIRVHDGVHPEYLAYALDGLSPRVLRLVDRASHGTGRLSTDSMRKLNIPMPPMSEQQAIAAFLGAIDDKMQVNRRLVATADSLALQNLEQAFRDASNDASLPDLVEFNPQVKLAKGQEYGFVEMSAVRPYVPTPMCIAKTYVGSGARFRQYDTLLARITPSLEHGKTAFVNFLGSVDSVGFGSTEFIVMRTRGKVSPGYVYYLARSRQIRDHAIANMTGSSGRQRVPVDCFDNLVVPLPDTATTGSLGRHFDEILELILSAQMESQTLEQLRGTLLPELISGRVRIPEAEAMVEEAV